MNRQKLEHLIETLDFVRRWQVGQTEAVDREIAKAQENYRTMVGHYYHFRENAFYETYGRQEKSAKNNPLSSVGTDKVTGEKPVDGQAGLRHTLLADTQNPQTDRVVSSNPNEADNVLIPEGFHFKCKLCNLEIPSPKEEPQLFDMNQDDGEEE